MKKMLIVLAAMTCANLSMAEDIRDYVKATLLDHVDLMTMYGFGEDQGPAKLAMVDSIIRIGSYQNSSILDIQGGFFGNSNEVEDENQVANWIGGAQLRVDTFLRGKIPFPLHWEFLNAVEHGPVAFRDFTNNKWFLGYSVGLSFGLEPNR